MTSFAAPRAIACPACGAIALVRTLLTANTFGTRRWSDGWVSAPGLPMPDPLARCPGCRAFFWRDELPPDERTAEQVLGAAVAAGPELSEQLQPDELRLALEQSVFRNADDERTLRLLLWWRTSPRLSAASPLADVGCVLGPVIAAITSTLALGSAEWTTWVIPGLLVALGLFALKNALGDQRARRAAAASLDARQVEALLPLLRDDPPEERLMRADALRQLGKMDEALALLAHREAKPAQEPWADAIRWAARQGDRLPRAM